MAFTRTVTVSKAFSRNDLLRLQVTIGLRRAKVEQGTIDKLRTAVARHWVEKIVVYGVDTSERAWCSLTMSIDWGRHELHLAAGRTTVSIDERWGNDTAVELDETLLLFEEFVAARKLTPRVHVWYTKGTDHNAIRTALGFVTAKPMGWAGYARGVVVGIPEIDEMSIGFDMVPD